MAKVGRPRKEVEQICGNCRWFCTNKVDFSGFCPHKPESGPRNPDQACTVQVTVPGFEPKRVRRPGRIRKVRAGEPGAGGENRVEAETGDRIKMGIGKDEPE